MKPEMLTEGGLLTRGVFALIIGILCFAVPIQMEAIIAYIIGLFLLIISLVTISISFNESGNVQWGVLILSIIGVIIALLMFISPFATFVALTILISAWAIITGLADLIIAFSLEELPFRILLGINGFFAVLFGLLIGLSPLPQEGALVIILLLGVYCLFFGIISLITGLLMKRDNTATTL